MAGAIVGLHVFGPDVGPEPLSNLDNNFSPLALALNSLNTFSNFYVDSGAVNASVASLATGQAATLSAGLTVELQMAATNTVAAPTFNLGGLGAKTITDINGFTLLVGQLQLGVTYTLIYTGTAWACQNINNLGTGDPLILKASKAATTSRISTTTPALDPDLTIAIPFAGRWAFQLTMFVTATVTTGMGIRSSIYYSGTLNAAFSWISVAVVNPSSAFPAGTFAQGISTVIATSFGFMSAATVSIGSPDTLTLFGMLYATGAGNLALSWSQGTGTAQNLNMIGGSFLTATLVS